jgi:hypothetical protein
MKYGRLWSGPATAVLLTATLGISALTPGLVAAQDLLGSVSLLFGSPRDERYPALATRYEPLAYGNPLEIPDVAPPLSLTPSPDSALHSTFCVRLCDGRFYPLSGPATASSATAAKTCSAMCPASRTATFRGGKIDDAAANNGDRYADLANAFVYREKIVPGCTCNGKTAFGLAPVDVANDPTLRPGDVVATVDGLKVFKGSKSQAHRTTDFTGIGSTALISRDLRRRLATMRISQER